MQDPFADTVEARKYIWDQNGILIPDSSASLPPSTARDLNPLADWVHAQGLKFGIHIVRGIPRQVVAQNLPIAGSSFHATDAADQLALPMGPGQLGRQGQRSRPGLLRLHAEALRRLGTRLHQG